MFFDTGNKCQFNVCTLLKDHNIVFTRNITMLKTVATSLDRKQIEIFKLLPKCIKENFHINALCGLAFISDLLFDSIVACHELINLEKDS